MLQLYRFFGSFVNGTAKELALSERQTGASQKIFGCAEVCIPKN
jgi:hypothetical protein